MLQQQQEQGMIDEQYNDDEAYYEDDYDEEFEDDNGLSLIAAAQPLHSDVPDEVYFNMTSLTNSWLAALHDYKVKCALSWS